MRYHIVINYHDVPHGTVWCIVSANTFCMVHFNKILEWDQKFQTTKQSVPTTLNFTRLTMRWDTRMMRKN